MNDSSQPNEPETTGSTLLDWATLLAFATALLYLTGWTYAYRYFNHFQVGLLALEIPAEYYFMYGVWVVRDWWWLVLLGYLVLALGLPWALSKLRPVWKRLVLVLLPLLFSATYPMAVSTADHHYQRQRLNDFPSYPRTRVWLTPAEEADGQVNTHEQLKLLSVALPQGCHRLLLQNSDKLFLFLPPPPAAPTPAPPARLATVELPLAQVQALRVLPQYGSCER